MPTDLDAVPLPSSILRLLRMLLPFFLEDLAVVYACESGSVAALGVAAVGAFISGGGGGGGGAGGGGGGDFGKHISLTFFAVRLRVLRNLAFRTDELFGRGAHPWRHQG